MSAAAGPTPQLTMPPRPLLDGQQQRCQSDGADGCDQPPERRVRGWAGNGHTDNDRQRVGADGVEGEAALDTVDRIRCDG